MISYNDDLDVYSEPCVILGSGFSRAISDHMPTMVELSGQVLSQLSLDPSRLDQFSGDLEQWMSYLSVDQPWLTPSQNLSNRALFADVSGAVNLCIMDAEAKVVLEPMPDWLLRLVWTWCDTQTNVFSFNYDTLVERTVTQLGRLGTWGDLYATSLSSRSTPGDGGAMFPVLSPVGPLLRMFKLHGSTSWAFSGLDSSPSDRIVLAADRLTWHGSVPPDEPTPPRYISRFDDVVPLIIPPTLTKGPYYSNLALKAQWRRAATSLFSASSLAIIGYSFPHADLVARQWVSTSFGGKRMDIVDRNPERPSQVRSGLPNSRDGMDSTGTGAVEEYVARECGPLVRWQIWSVGDEFGARVKLIVNGTDLVAHIDPADMPWGKELHEAQRWVHERIERYAPGAIDRARSESGPSGSLESRFVVLPPGAMVDIS